jgi:superfamily II DNA helicase RecQ
VTAAFEDAHGFAPRDWQRSTESYLLECCSRRSSSKPQPVLLVGTTRSDGESAVRDVVGYSTSGVVITVVPLLSLAADQVNKLKPLEAKHSTVSAYNIDSIRNGDAKRQLQVALCALPSKNTSKTIFLFASPQTFTLNPSWVKTFEQLIKNGNIKLMAI